MGLRFRGRLGTHNKVQSRWLRDIPSVIQSRQLAVSYIPYIYAAYVPYTYDSTGRAEDAIPPIYVSDAPIFIEAADLPTVEIDLREQIRGTDRTKESYTVNITNVVEQSESVLSTPWDAENPFVTIDENNIIQYELRGTYLWNVLTLDTEVSDILHPPTDAAQQLAANYRTEETEALEFVEEGSNPALRKFKLVVDDDVIGDPERAKAFFENQGNSGTCILVAGAVTLESVAAVDTNGEEITYERVYEDFVAIYEYNPSTGETTLVQDSNAKNILGNPYYVRIDTVNTNGAVTEGNTWPNTSRPIGGQVNRNLEHLPEDDLGGTATWLIPNDITEYYQGNENYRSERASNFTTLIHELDAGNPVIAFVDSYELTAPSSAVVTAQQAADENHPGLRSVQNHAVWITGIDKSDSDNPMIILNDSARGGIVRYPLKQFLAAWEDSEFMYQAYGDAPIGPGEEYAHEAETIAFNRRREMRKTAYDPISNIPSIFVQNGYSHEYTDENPDTTEVEHELTQISFKTIFDYPSELQIQLLDEMERQNAGTKDDFERWKELIVMAEVEVVVDYGLDIDEINTIADEVDFE